MDAHPAELTVGVQKVTASEATGIRYSTIARQKSQGLAVLAITTISGMPCMKSGRKHLAKSVQD